MISKAHRCHSPAFGWMFGQAGPVVRHAPPCVRPGSWVWFLTDTVCFITNDWRIEPCES